MRTSQTHKTPRSGTQLSEACAESLGGKRLGLFWEPEGSECAEAKCTRGGDGNGSLEGKAGLRGHVRSVAFVVGFTWNHSKV